MTQPSRMRLTVLRGAEFWNDSCSLTELKDAVDHGATGATSNPVIVYAVVKADPKISFQSLITFIDNTQGDRLKKEKIFEQIVFDNSGVGK